MTVYYIDWRIVLKWILRRCGMRAWIRLIYLRSSAVAASSEHNNGTRGCIQGGEFPGQWSNYQFLERNFSAWDWLLN
jgi:hypothetical protein